MKAERPQLRRGRRGVLKGREIPGERLLVMDPGCCRLGFGLVGVLHLRRAMCAKKRLNRVSSGRNERTMGRKALYYK